MSNRDFTPAEKALVSFLLRSAKKDDRSISEFFSETRCSDMDDGRMGSIKFIPIDNAVTSAKRTFGHEMSSCHFYDENGVMVSVALYADSLGVPFELDVWKVDFSPLKRMPNDSGEYILDSTMQSTSTIERSKAR